MDILWSGTYVREFERNERLAEYLEASGSAVRHVHRGLWPSDRVEAFQRGRVKIFARMLHVYPMLFFQLLFARRPDVFLVSYPGWFDIPIVKLVALLKRRPIVFDIFISLYDTAVTDRELAATRSGIAKFAKSIDRLSMRLSDRILSDTRTHATFLAEIAGLPPTRFGVVYVGADETVFKPSNDDPDPTRLVFYGTFVPLQGVDVIVRAASRLSDLDLRFRLIGAGQTLKATMQLAADLEVMNVEFVPPMPLAELMTEMSQAALCLGVFGTSPKVSRVVPHKVYEALAAGRPLITGQTGAIKEIFDEGELLAVPTGDPDELARAIKEAIEDRNLLKDVAQAGRARFVRDFARKPQSDRLMQELGQVIP